MLLAGLRAARFYLFLYEFIKAGHKERSFEVLGYANYSETRGLHPVGALARPHWISG